MTLQVEALEPLFYQPSDLATSARQLDLEVVPMSWARQWNHDWHSQLPDLGTSLGWGDVRIAHALTFDGGVYAVAIWTRPIAANRMAHPTDHMVELRRLAIPDYSPKYTASRMLGRMERWFKRERDECRLLSYQMTDVHSGTIYKAANWHRTSEQLTFQSWQTSTRHRPIDTATAPKIRWERHLRKCDAVKIEEPQLAV